MLKFPDVHLQNTFISNMTSAGFNFLLKLSNFFWLKFGSSRSIFKRFIQPCFSNSNMPRKHKLLQTLTKSHKSHIFSTKNLILIWWLQMVRKMGGIKSILLYQNIFYHKFIWLAISILFTSIITERNYWSRFDWLYLINRATELSNFQNGLFFHSSYYLSWWPNI